jgi:DNA-binding transcriptional LysR family regulator
MRKVDLVVTTHRPGQFDCLTLRTSPTHWYCAAEYAAKREPVPLVLLDDPSPFRDMVLTALNEANIPWRLAYVASTLPAVRAAVKAGLGVTARPVEMMSPDLRVWVNLMVFLRCRIRNICSATIRPAITSWRKWCSRRWKTTITRGSSSMLPPKGG